MFTMKKFPYVLQFWFALFMASIMTIVMGFINTGGIQFPGVLMDILVGVVLAYIAGIVIPVKKLADGFARLFKAKDDTLAFLLLSTVIYALYYSIVFSVFFTARAIGFPPYFLSAVISGIPSGFVVGYVVSIIVTPLALKLTYKMCSKPMGSH